MANCIDYKDFLVGPVSVSPSSSTIRKLAKAAIYYVDEAPVRYRGDSRSANDGNEPTRHSGLPIYPGGYIILVGEGNMANAKFVRKDDKTAHIYVLYYDQVDIVAANMAVPPDDTGITTIISLLKEVTDTLTGSTLLANKLLDKL